MFRTSRTGRRLSAALTWMGEWRLSGEERRGVRSNAKSIARGALSAAPTTGAPTRETVRSKLR